MRTGNCFICTYTGKRFSLVDPQPSDICFDDVKHHLAKQCRFTGACREFYSVAQHSHHVSFLVDEKLAGDGFGHDFGEAITGDFSSGLKAVLRDVCGEGFDLIINRIEVVVAGRFGISWPKPKQVDLADRKALSIEWDNFMPALQKPAGWPKATNVSIDAWGHEATIALFDTRYRDLKREGLIG
jgi:hypothetical protein